MHPSRPAQPRPERGCFEYKGHPIDKVLAQRCQGLIGECIKGVTLRKFSAKCKQAAGDRVGGIDWGGGGRTYLLRLGPLLLGEQLVLVAALEGSAESVDALVGLLGG